MTSKIWLFNHWGELETTLEGIPTTPRSWVMNKYGTCEFTLDLTDPKCTLRNLQFGNLVYVEHIPTFQEEEQTSSGQLPGWVGIILPPRLWDSEMCHVTAHSVEALLAYRALPYKSVTGTPGAVFKEIMELANKFTDVLPFQIPVGRVDDVQMTYSDDLRTNAYDHINKLASAANMRWEITGQIVPESYALQLTASLRTKGNAANLSYTLGKNNVYTMGTLPKLNTLNTEARGTLLTEQGAPVNEIFAYTQANTDADRIMLGMRFPDSINKYGLFQLNVTYVGVHDAASLADTIASKTARGNQGEPSVLFKRVVLNQGNIFNSLRLDNFVVVDEPRVGFNSFGGFGFTKIARILSMTYNDLTDKCDLNLNVEIVPYG